MAGQIAVDRHVRRHALENLHRLLKRSAPLPFLRKPLQKGESMSMSDTWRCRIGCIISTMFCSQEKQIDRSGNCHRRYVEHEKVHPIYEVMVPFVPIVPKCTSSVCSKGMSWEVAGCTFWTYFTYIQLVFRAY